MDLLGGTSLVNATFQLCGVRKVADYFFVSTETSGLISGAAMVAQPFTAQEVDFGQSLAMCPARLQNIQSSLSK